MTHSPLSHIKRQARYKPMIFGNTRPSDSAIKPHTYTAGWSRSRIGRRLAPIKAIALTAPHSPGAQRFSSPGWVHRLERLRVLLAAFSAQTERRSLRPRSSSSQVRPSSKVSRRKRKEREGRRPHAASFASKVAKGQVWSLAG